MLAAERDLDQGAYEGEAVASFSLAERAYMGVYIAIEGINTTYFDLSLAGPEGFSATILHGEGYRAEARRRPCGSSSCRQENTAWC
jgi:hypothetical protein